MLEFAVCLYADHPYWTAILAGIAGYSLNLLFAAGTVASSLTAPNQTFPNELNIAYEISQRRPLPIYPL
jgi:hypothetical protein